MDIKAIGQDRIASMLAQLRAAGAQARGGSQITGAGPASAMGLAGSSAASAATGSAPTGTSFADALKVSLDKVNQSQNSAEALSQQFALGDERVSLSDVMIERQKASLSLQATVQIRNKLVSAYHEIMSMQV